MNWNFLDIVCAESGYDPYGENEMPLTELTALQNDWMTARAKESERYNIPEPDRYYAVTGLTILNGDSRTEETYFSGSRARDIRITVNGAYSKELTLADSPAPQLITLDCTQPTIAKPVDITLEVLSSYPGETGAVYLTEIGVGLASNLPQGR